jgi:hypothetical protein
MERRKHVHECIGAALETLYATSLDDHFGELAHHYSRSANADKAVNYLTLASKQALERSAFNEALAHARAGVALILALPATAERGRSEFALLSTVATAATAIEGFGSPQTTQGSRRMLELAREAGDDELLSTALTFFAGEPSSCRASQGRSGSRATNDRGAERRRNPVALADAHHLTARTLLPTDEGLGRHHHQRATPIEPAAQE